MELGFFYHKFVFHEHCLIEKRKKFPRDKEWERETEQYMDFCRDGCFLGKIFWQGSKMLPNPELSPGSVVDDPVGEQGWLVCGTPALLDINS